MNKLPFRIGSSPFNGINLDPSFTGSVYHLSFDRLTASNAGGRGCSLTVKGFSSTSGTPKLYVEITVNSGTQPNVGIAQHGLDINNDLGHDTKGWSYETQSGVSATYHNNSFVAFGTAFGAGDKIMIALDCTNGYVYFGNNGTWNGGATGAGITAGTGVGAAFSGLSGTFYFALSNYGGTASNITINTGGSAFAYTPPTGFVGF